MVLIVGGNAPPTTKKANMVRFHVLYGVRATLGMRRTPLMVMWHTTPAKMLVDALSRGESAEDNK